VRKKCKYKSWKIPFPNHCVISNYIRSYWWCFVQRIRHIINIIIMNDVFNTIKTNDGHVYIITMFNYMNCLHIFARIDEYNRGCFCSPK